VILHDKARANILDGPGRREAAADHSRSSTPQLRR
jgi:hypothetical protein